MQHAAGPADFAGALALLSVQRSSALWAIPEELASQALQELLQAARPRDLQLESASPALSSAAPAQPQHVPQQPCSNSAHVRASEDAAVLEAPVSWSEAALQMHLDPIQEQASASLQDSTASDLLTAPSHHQGQHQAPQQQTALDPKFSSPNQQIVPQQDPQQDQLPEAEPTAEASLSLRVELTDSSMEGHRAWEPLSGTFRWSAESSAVCLPGLVLGCDARAASGQRHVGGAWEHAGSLLGSSDAGGAPCPAMLTSWQLLQQLLRVPMGLFSCCSLAGTVRMWSSELT